MKKESSENQQRVLRKLLRNNKPQLPVMNIPGIRKATLPYPVGKRNTRSETLRVKNDRVTKVDNEDSVESADSLPEQQKNVSHSKASSHETMEGAEDRKKPRKKRISRALFRHDAINYIKPKKQELLQKSFTFDFKKLVDKSKEIILKTDDSEGDDKAKEKNCETTDMDKILSPNNGESSSEKVSHLHSMEHLLLDMPSLDSPCSTENIQQPTEAKKSSPNVPKAESTEAQIQTNNSQNLLYRFYGLIPNKPRTTEQTHEQRKYKISIVPDVPKSNENDKRIIPPNTSKEIPVHFTPPVNISQQNIPNKILYPYLHTNYGYCGYPFLPQFPQNYQQITKNVTNAQINKNENNSKTNCTIVKETAAQENRKTKYNFQNYAQQIPLVQNLPHRQRTDDKNTNQAQKRSSDTENHQNKRVCLNLETNTINNQSSSSNKTTPVIVNNEKSVIISPKPKESNLDNQPVSQCSVIKKVSSSKNLHTIENILAKPEKEIGNNKNHTKIENEYAQKSVIIAPKTDSLNNNNTRKMPLNETPEDLKTKTKKYEASKDAETSKEQVPLNLSLKPETERQSIIVNNTPKDPLRAENLTLVKNEEQFNEYLKLLEEKNATGPYLFYKFICNVRKKYNQPMFDLLTFFVLLKQGKLLEYKEMYNQCFK